MRHDNSELSIVKTQVHQLTRHPPLRRPPHHPENKHCHIANVQNLYMLIKKFCDYVFTFTSKIKALNSISEENLYVNSSTCKVRQAVFVLTHLFLIVLFFLWLGFFLGFLGTASS